MLRIPQHFKRLHGGLLCYHLPHLPLLPSPTFCLLSLISCLSSLVSHLSSTISRLQFHHPLPLEPPGGGVKLTDSRRGREDDRWVERGEVVFQQGWKMTTRLEGMNLSARRG